MQPLLEEGDEGEEDRNQPLTLAEHKLSETKCQWILFFVLKFCFIIWCVLDPSISILLVFLAFIPSLIMYKWWRKIYRRGGLPEFPDTVREYTLAFWFAHFISFVAVVFWFLLVFELTLASAWWSCHSTVEEEIGCQGMVLYDTSCADISISECEFNGPFDIATGCSWKNQFEGCVTNEEETYYPCTTGIDGKESYYDQESYQEKVDLETFQRLRSSFELNAFMIFLIVGQGIIEQSIKYYFSQRSRKKFPTMLSETHIDGILYLVTIIGIAFGTAAAILDVAVDLMAGNTILFLLVTLFFGTFNHGVTSYLIGIGLCKRYILRQNEQTYFRIISMPILIQWCFDYGKWWLLDSTDRPTMQLFFTLMCIAAFMGGYCVLSRQRLSLRNEFLSGGMAQSENTGVQLQVTSYCTEENDDGLQGPEGNQTNEKDIPPPPAYEEPGEQSHLPDDNSEPQVQQASVNADGKEEERLLLAQTGNSQAIISVITSSSGSDEEEPLKNEAKSLSEVELLDSPPSSGKPSKREALERRTGGSGPSQT